MLSGDAGDGEGPGPGGRSGHGGSGPDKFRQCCHFERQQDVNVLMSEQRPRKIQSRRHLFALFASSQRDFSSVSGNALWLN